MSEVALQRNSSTFPAASTPAGTVLVRERHPLQFLPLLYESQTPEQRRKLRDADIAMRLVLLPRKPEIFADGFESGSAEAWTLPWSRVE